MMTMPMDHDRCSELLRPFLAGGLEEQDAHAVREHLSSCEECSSEAAGLRMLLAEPGVPLGDEERARLRAAVRAALPVSGAVVPLTRSRSMRPERSWGSRIGILAGAAAALLVVAVGVYFVGTQVGGGDDAAGTAAGVAEDRARFEAAGGGPLPVFASGDSLRSAADLNQDEEKAEPDAMAYNNARLTLVEVSEKSLARLGRQEPFTRFADAYTGRDVEELATTFAQELAGQAPGDAAAEQVLDCSEQTFDARPSPSLPAYAAFSQLHGDDVFVLGLVFAASPDEPADRSMFLVWPVGDCNNIVYFSTGVVGD